MNGWVLQTTDPPEAPTLTFRLAPGTVRTMGRAAPADFVLAGRMVSRVHCRLIATDSGELEVEDLASTNGTFVNGRRVARTVLVAGDRIRLGRVELTVARASVVLEQ